MCENSGVQDKCVRTHGYKTNVFELMSIKQKCLNLWVQENCVRRKEYKTTMLEPNSIRQAFVEPRSTWQMCLNPRVQDNF